MSSKFRITVFILFALLARAFAQKPADIFAEGKEYIYQVVFIKSNGDTLTDEKMIILGREEQWHYQKKQTLIEYKYFPDTVSLKKYIDPRIAYQKRKVKNLRKKVKRKSWSNYTWISKEEVTGKLITDSSIWIHPPRSNQYTYHYMNAYPEIEYKELKVGGKWTLNMIITGGLPSNKEFKGKRTDVFEVTESLSTDFKGKKIEDCWRIEITSTHSTKGLTTAEYIFSETHGFLKMNYLFYDGVRINYVLKDIILN